MFLRCCCLTIKRIFVLQERKNMISKFSISEWIIEQIDENKRRQPEKRKKTRKKEKPKPPYTSKEDEYNAQKPCCRSNGKIGH